MKVRPPLSAAHIVAVLALLAGQFVVFQLILLGMFYALVNTREACLNSPCRGHWMSVGTQTVIFGGGALLVITGVIAIWRLATRRRSINLAVTACVLQVVLALIALMMLGLASG